MPYKIDKMSIGDPKNDKRVKLTVEDRENIRLEYAQGGTSHNKLAQKYGVSKRLVQFVLSPEKQIVAKQQFAERQKDGRYYDKDKHKEYTKKHRNYKKELHAKGLLSEKEKTNGEEEN